MTWHPLRVMDPEISLKDYLAEVGVPYPGPYVLMDENNVVKRISQELGQELIPETCYLEQLWLRVDPGGAPDEGGGGSTAPDWVPADAKIHIDLVGGTPQGRAWVDGTGEVAVETLLGSDPNTSGWGTTDYDGANLTADGYVWPPGSDASLGMIGSLRSAVISGSTFVLRFKTLTSDVPGFGVSFVVISIDGMSAIEIDLKAPATTINAYSWTGTFDETSGPILNAGAGAKNVLATTLTPTRCDCACNGSLLFSNVLTSTEFPTTGDSAIVAALIDQSIVRGALVAITIYDPLPSTDGLSELSEIDGSPPTSSSSSVSSRSISGGSIG